MAVRRSLRMMQRFLRQPWRNQVLLLEALLWLGIVGVLVRVVPFRRIAPYLGNQMRESPTHIAPVFQAQVARIGWAVQTVNRWLPWPGTCLVQAIAAKRMLQRRKIASTLYLGVRRPAEHALQAHAWLRSGEAILTGAPAHQGYTVISTFAEQALFHSQSHDGAEASR